MKNLRRSLKNWKQKRSRHKPGAGDGKTKQKRPETGKQSMKGNLENRSQKAGRRL
jgi:hypothetical protein